MKKLLIIWIILSISSLLYSYKFTIKLNDGTKHILNIPDNKIELRNAYIDMSKLYLEAEKDNEESIKTIDKLNKQIDKLQEQNISLLQLTKNAPKQQISIFRPNLKLGIDYNIDKSINADVGLGVTLFEWVDIGLLVRIPDISLGLLLTVYLGK